MDASQITTRLWIGANINTDQDAADLIALGITHVIDCNTDDESQLIRGRMALLSDPTDDDGQPKSPDWFKPGIAFGVAALAAPGNRLYVHCAAGVNRGPSMGYAIMRVLGWASDEALAWIRARRPVTLGGIHYASDADAAVLALGWIKP